MTLLAGAARADISPTTSQFLVGYPHVERMSEGVHDPLYASALCLENGDNRILMIALDILKISRPDALACRRNLAQETGIPEEAILLGATHTHSGPITAEIIAWRYDRIMRPADPEYLELFREGIVRAGIEAWRNRAPARLGLTAARVDGVGGNRISPDGPRDPEAGILVVRRDGEKNPAAIQVIYSMHPTVLHEDTRLVTADFPGAMRSALERRWPGAQAAYYMGPAGNQSPRYHVRGQTFSEAERLGERLADAVAEAVQALPESAFDPDPVLAAARDRVRVEPRAFPPVAEAREGLREARATYERLKKEGAPHGPVRTAECTVFGAEGCLALAEAQERGALEERRRLLREAEIQVLRLGGHAIIGLPGEIFIEYSLDIKRRAVAPAFVISNLYEMQGYLVTPEAEAAGGYEARLSFFSSEAGARLAEGAVNLAGTLF